MKRGILHILMAGVIALLAHSCAQEDIPAATDSRSDTGKVTIRFTLDLGEQGMASRGAWGTTTTTTGDREQGDRDYENLIDMSPTSDTKLQVIVLDTDNGYKGHLSGLKVVRVESSKYTFDGKLEVPESFIRNQTLSCKLMVIANSESVLTTTDQGVTSVDYTKVFNYNPENYHHGASTKKLIPMWGIATLSNVWLPQQVIKEVGDIYLLRAMAKIEVTLKDELYTKGYRIMGATLNKYLTEGLVFPKKTDVASTTVLDTDDAIATVAKTNSFNPSTASNITATGTWGTSNFTDYGDTDDKGNILTQKTWVIYVPEMANADNSIKMLLNLGKVNASGTVTSMTTTEELKAKHTIELKDYTHTPTDAEPYKAYDVVRNWYYRYTINSIEDGVEPELTVSVSNWNLQVENMSFADYVSVGTDGQIRWFEGNSIEGTPITPVKSTAGDEAYIYSDDKDGVVTCQFNISTPEGGTWYAALIGSGEDATAFQITNATQVGTDNQQYAEYTSTLAKGKVGMGPITLTIKTVAERPVNENNEAILQIYVETYDKRTIAVKELLNQTDYSGIDMCTLIQRLD